MFSSQQKTKTSCTIAATLTLNFDCETLSRLCNNLVENSGSPKFYIKNLFPLNITTRITTYLRAFLHLLGIKKIDDSDIA